jgi:glycosyltransferase involved in cell wall biosynthesis
MEVAIFATFVKDADLSTVEELRHEGIEFHLVGPCYRLLAWHWQIGRVARQVIPQFQVIHLHALWEEIHHQAARASRANDRPYIIRPCGLLDPWSLAQQGLKKRLCLAWRVRNDLDRAAAIHFTTDIERDLTAPLQLRAPSLVEPNGIDLEEINDLPPKGTFLARYPGLIGRPVVLFLSRLHHKKGLELLIPAFARIDSQNAILVIAGPDADNYRPVLESLVDRCHLRERVVFTGMLKGKDRIAALADADLFVLPSYQENFGISVVEALAVGTPVIVSDQVNIYPEIQAAKVGGVVPLQVEPLVLELNRWLADASLRQVAAARARQLVRDRYDWQAIARRWAENYTRLLG